MTTLTDTIRHEIESRFRACPAKNFYLTNAMPAEKLSNAKATFASNSFRHGETPLLLVDATTFGSCKSGLLITDEGIYVGDQKEKARSHWLEIASAEKSWLRLKLNGTRFSPIDLDGNVVSLVADALNAVAQTIPTVVFPADTALITPNQCVGCSTPEPGFLLLAPAIPLKKGDSLAAKLAGKSAQVSLSLALGPILGAAAYNLPSLFKASGLDFYYLPVCHTCKAEGSGQAFLITDGESVAARFRNTQYAQALKCSLGAPIPDDCRAVTIAPERRSNLEAVWGRQLSPLEAVLANAWSEIAQVLGAFTSHPNISDKKLAAARTHYWKADYDALVLALYDATLFGSANRGLLITTEGLYWNLGDAADAMQLRTIIANPGGLSGSGMDKVVIDFLQSHMSRDGFLGLRAFLRYAVVAGRIVREAKKDELT